MGNLYSDRDCTGNYLISTWQLKRYNRKLACFDICAAAVFQTRANLEPDFHNYFIRFFGAKMHTHRVIYGRAVVTKEKF